MSAWNEVGNAPIDVEVVVYVPGSQDQSVSGYAMLATCGPSKNGEMMWWPKDGQGWLEFNEPSHWRLPPPPVGGGSE